MARSRALLAVFPLLIAGVVLVVFGTSRTELECHRPERTCTWRDGILGGSPVTFPMTDVHEVRLVDNYGRHASDGHVELHLKNGDVMAFGKGERGRAAAQMTDETKRFLSAEGTRLYFAAPTLVWMCFLGAGCLLGVLVIVLSAKRPKWNDKLRVLAVLAGLLGLGGSIATCATRDDPGLTIQ